MLQGVRQQLRWHSRFAESGCCLLAQPARLLQQYRSMCIRPRVELRKQTLAVLLACLQILQPQPCCFVVPSLFAVPTDMFSRRLVGSLRAVARCRTYAEKVVMPALSPTMEAGTVAVWKKQVGMLPCV